MLDTKTRGSHGGSMHLTEHVIEIPNRFKIQVYKSDGSVQNGTIDIKMILEYEPMGDLDTTAIGWR